MKHIFIFKNTCKLAIPALFVLLAGFAVLICQPGKPVYPTYTSGFLKPAMPSDHTFTKKTNTAPQNHPLLFSA